MGFTKVLHIEIQFEMHLKTSNQANLMRLFDKWTYSPVTFDFVVVRYDFY